jgi:hypothetical protein
MSYCSFLSLQIMKLVFIIIDLCCLGFVQMKRNDTCARNASRKLTDNYIALKPQFSVGRRIQRKHCTRQLMRPDGYESYNYDLIHNHDGLSAEVNKNHNLVDCL